MIVPLQPPAWEIHARALVLHHFSAQKPSKATRAHQEVVLTWLPYLTSLLFSQALNYKHPLLVLLFPKHTPTITCRVFITDAFSTWHVSPPPPT